MADVYNRVAMLVDGNPACALRVVRKDKIVLQVANPESGVDILGTLMHVANIQGSMSLGRDNKSWFLTITQ